MNGHDLSIIALLLAIVGLELVIIWLLDQLDSLRGKHR